MSNDLKVPRLLTVKELSDATGIPVWRIYELVEEGGAPASMRIGKTLRFPMTEWCGGSKIRHQQEGALTYKQTMSPRGSGKKYKETSRRLDSMTL